MTGAGGKAILVSVWLPWVGARFTVPTRTRSLMHARHGVGFGIVIGEAYSVHTCIRPQPVGVLSMLNVISL